MEERSRGSDVIVLEDNIGERSVRILLLVLLFYIMCIPFASPLLQLLRGKGSTDNQKTALFQSYSEMVTKVAGILYGEREN